jgi:hypothetical protein
MANTNNLSIKQTDSVLTEILLKMD